MGVEQGWCILRHCLGKGTGFVRIVERGLRWDGYRDFIVGFGGVVGIVMGSVSSPKIRTC